MKDVTIYVIVRFLLLVLLLALFQGDLNKEQVSCISACLPPHTKDHSGPTNMP